MLSREMIQTLQEELTKQPLSPEPAVVPVRNGLFEDMFPFNQDDIMKGFVFSMILARPKCEQRGGNPWRSRYW